MSLKVALQMDPVADINIQGDTSFVMGLEAQKRGYELYYYHPNDLTLNGNVLSAPLQPLELRREKGNHFTLGEAVETDLSTMDVILMRQDPPFDISYITATHLLEHLRETTLVMNDPVGVRNAPEKLLVTHFWDLMPPTLISRNMTQIDAFRAKHKDIIIKPLHGNGGAEIFFIKEGDSNYETVLEMFFDKYKEPLMVQAFVKEVTEGDKRIILIDGEPVGAINRVPAKGDIRANLAVGGSAGKTTLTEREIEICARLRPVLQEQGLVLTGIDVIAGHLTEINVTSPTGIQSINALDGVCLEAVLWDAFERKLKEKRQNG